LKKTIIQGLEPEKLRYRINAMEIEDLTIEDLLQTIGENIEEMYDTKHKIRQKGD
jgi:hypothetical protein